MTSAYINEIRWLELDTGLAAVQRSWLDGEAVSTADWVNMEAQYYLGITYQTENGSDTVAASWAAIMVGDLPLPEDTAVAKQWMHSENGADLTCFRMRTAVIDRLPFLLEEQWRDAAPPVVLWIPLRGRPSEGLAP